MKGLSVSFVGTNSLAEIPAAHTPTAGFCCMLSRRNLELDCNQNS